jgi:hypothetical protein
MCFNETASILAFGVGVTVSALLYFQNELHYSFILLFISFIQLFEFFIHRALKTGNARMNSLFTTLIFIFVVLQPLVFVYLLHAFPVKGSAFVLPNYLRSNWLLLAYAVVALWAFYEMRYSMKTTSVEECGTVCRLNWFSNTPFLPPLVLFIFYLCVVVTYLYTDARLYVKHIIPVTLVLSWIYVFLLKGSVRKKFTYAGSLWCFLSVFGGIFLLFRR